MNQTGQPYIQYFAPQAILRLFAFLWYTPFKGGFVYEPTNRETAQKKYMDNPPEGMTSEDIRRMSEDDLLDMDYFLHEFDDLDDDDWGKEGFYIF